MYSDMPKWGILGGGNPPIYLLYKSSHVRGVELSDQLGTIIAQTMSCPLKTVFGEEIVDLWHGGEISCKNPPLQCKGPCHDTFII